MGWFGSGDKIQTDETTQIGASDEALLQNLQNSYLANEDLIQNSNLASGELLGAQNSNIGDVSITDGGAFDLVKYIAGLQAETNASALGAVGDNAAAAAGNQNNLLAAVLDSLSTLSESKQTEGQSGLNKTFLWAIGLVVVGVVLYFWKKK